MRTSKKNESGILNHSICGSNEGYSTWKKGDPKASGFTFASMSYPGALYNVGSMFREKDMGNLLQLVFTARGYFRHQNLELITDSHFGHLTPLAYSRLWKLFITSSFTVSQRIGVSSIDQLSNKKLQKSEREALLQDLQKEEREVKDQIVEISNSDVSDYCEEEGKEKKTTYRGLKSRLDFFERKFKQSKKGTYQLWETNVRLLPAVQVPIYLHAVNDSKPVYRISNRYAAKPSVEMNFTNKDATTRKKVLVENKTSEAHRTFRFGMGFNDGSDRMRTIIGLSGRYYRAWPKHLVANVLEDCILNGYGNYLLDPNCGVEAFTEFAKLLIQEFIDSGASLRKNRVQTPKRSYRRSSKRPRPGSDRALATGESCRAKSSLSTVAFIPYAKRSQLCQFCGRQKAAYRCRSCQAHLCMQPPRGFPPNGPVCFLRFHTINKFPRL